MKLVICILTLFFIACSSQNEVPQGTRIIATYRPMSHIVMALGKQQYLVGGHANSNIPLFNALLPHEITLVGSKAKGVNIETVVSLHPTIVLGYPTVDGYRMQEQLKQFNIPTFMLKIESLQEIQDSLIALGKELQAEAQAQNVISEMNRIMNIVDSHLQKNPAIKKRIFFASSSQFLRTYSNQMLQHEMIERAGAIDVSEIKQGGSANISLEQLILWNPDYIILSATSLYSQESVINNEQYSLIRAVQEKKLCEMPDKKIVGWDFPCPDSVLGILWISKTCYPELFSDIDLMQEEKTFYQTVYHVDITKLK